LEALEVRKHPLILSALTLLLFIMTVPRPAQAYVDPGSGAMVWQMLAAAVVGCGFYVHKIARKLRSVLRPAQNRVDNAARSAGIPSSASGD
jgi:hypothetical protein